MFYATRHHSGVVMRKSAVETATHLLAKAESPLYFSARMAVVPDGLEDNGFPVSTLFFRSGGGSPGTLHKVAHAH